LLLDPLGGKDRIDNLAGIDADLFSPFTETVTVPLQIFLVVLRHMLRNCAVLPLTTVSAAVRGDSVMIKEDLDYLISYPHIDLTFDKFVRNGV
jgi:hypothetical protein